MINFRDHPIKKKVKHIVCPSCHGKGATIEIEQKVEPCISCRGTGQAHHAKCFVCGGAGSQTITHSHLVECPECEGTGWIIAEPAYAHA